MFRLLRLHQRIGKPEPKQKPKPKPKTKPVDQVFASMQDTSKEVVIPLFIEKTIEPEEYEIEYVKLVPIKVEDMMYFIDKKKNKLYENVKDKIGKYIGRLYNDSIITELDSDDE